MSAAKQEKSEYLKARVTEQIKKDYEIICADLGVKPADQMRELVTAFITQEQKRLGQRVQVRITRPDGYDHGAWRMEIKLKDPEQNELPLIFPTTGLPYRSVHSDPEHRAVWYNHAIQLNDMGGLLQNGVWRGHLYSNGIAESDNPTTLADVEQHFQALIEKLLVVQAVEPFWGPTWS